MCVTLYCAHTRATQMRCAANSTQSYRAWGGAECPVSLPEFREYRAGRVGPLPRPSDRAGEISALDEWPPWPFWIKPLLSISQPAAYPFTPPKAPRACDRPLGVKPQPGLARRPLGSAKVRKYQFLFA